MTETDDQPIEDFIREVFEENYEELRIESGQALAPFTAHLLGEIADIPQQEVRWHVAQMLPRLPLDEGGCKRAVAILESYLDDESAIVRTSSMQALADLALRTPRIAPRGLRMLRNLTEAGTPAMKARGRKLVAKLEGSSKHSR